MDETAFLTLARHTLERLFVQIETLDEKGSIDAEVSDGMLTLSVNGGQYIVSRHTPSRQLWLASPISGGLHFSYDANEKTWRLPDGTELEALLMRELRPHLPS